MDLIHVVVLALIQGITEFLPISSSAHLILPKEILGWPDQGLAFDVAVHVGTLAAVIVYFRKDITEIIVGWLRSVTGRGTDTNGRLAWYIAAATVPAALFGLIFDELIETHLRSTQVIAVTTLVFGGLLWLADRTASQRRQLADVALWSSLVIGLAQAVALIPGTSRSGITITAALLLGFSRTDAARFSFLLSIPVILLSGGYKGLQLVVAGAPVDWLAILLGVAVSAISAYVCIHYFLSFINRIGMLPFVVYRLILGLLLVFVV